MDGSDASTQVAPQSVEDAYDGPPDQRTGARHAMYPDLSHDEVERFNFLTQMGRPTFNNNAIQIQEIRCRACKLLELCKIGIV